MANHSSSESRVIGVKDIRENGLEVTERIIEQLESEETDKELISGFAGAMRVIGYEICPSYAEEMFERLQSPDYDSARELAKALEQNFDELLSLPSERNFDESIYERSRDSSLEFVYRTVGDIDGYDWEKAEENGIV